MDGAVLVAKMYMNSRTESLSHDGETTIEQVRLSAVSGKANEPWSKWTPSGSLELQITNPDAHKRVQPGQNYKVYLVPCGKDD